MMIKMYIRTSSGEIICKEINNELDIDEQLVGHQDSIYADLGQFRRIEWIKNELRARNAQKPIMEIGTACGFVLNYVCGDYGDNCTANIGIDIRPDRLLVAKRKYPKTKFYYANILNLEPFYNMGIKNIIAAEIFEHMQYSHVHFGIIHCLRCLDREGRIYYTIPNSEIDSSVAKNIEHLWSPTYHSLKTLFEYVGMHMEIKYEINSIDNFFCGTIMRK